jgi:hypothetical protein
VLSRPFLLNMTSGGRGQVVLWLCVAQGILVRSLVVLKVAHSHVKEYKHLYCGSTTSLAAIFLLMWETLELDNRMVVEDLEKQASGGVGSHLIVVL